MSRARTNKENRPKRPSTLGLLLGGTGGRKDASKGAEAERQRRRRERDRSREMDAYVGYDAMYRDGIAQVMPGVFSQTVEFSDISYQSARKEARETAFTVMSSLFNYFPADSHVQLQVVNAPIPADEVGRKVFFEPGERATAGLAEEYNRILNDKMREGVSNLVRHRYLTYAVGADDVDAAVPKLARIRGDVEQTLARIRCSSRALDGAERLELLQGQLRPGSRFEFSWDKLSPTSGARTKDFVMPSTLDFKPEGRSDCFCSDGRYGAVLAVRSFGSVIEETYLASIIDLPLPLNVTLHVQPIAQSEALALVKRQIDWMDKEIIDEQMSAVKKGYDYQILPPELRFSKEEAEELLDFLRNKSERLFVYTGLVYTWADSLEELDRRVQQVTSVAQGCTIGLEPLHFRQRQALNSVLPLGDNHVTVSRYLTTGQVAMQMPFASQSLDEAGGGYYGQSKESGNLVLCDRKRLASPMGFVCGKPGSGKSFSVKREITNTVLAHPEDEVVIFDPAGEYGNLVGALGGANVELAPGCSAVLNPLDTADVADRADAAKLAYKTDAVLALSSALMAEGREGLPERDRSIIARCVGEAYRECARDGRLPTLGDFHAALLAQPEPEAADIALRYERYVKGAFSFFNGQSNVALDNRITNIDMHGLGQNMRVFGMITALEMVRNRVMVTPPRTLTIFEQFANDLYGETARGGGDVETRERHIRQLLNFFPVYGEDEEGQMVELDAEQVLSVPRRIHAREVVRRGFMSNFLFQNIASVFRAPAEVVEIIQRFDPYEQGKAQNAEKNKVEIDEGTADELSINDEGEVEIPDEQVVGKAADIFGPKVYGDIAVEFSGHMDDIAKAHEADDDDRVMLDNLKEAFKQSVTAPLVQAAKESYGSELKPRQQQQIERKVQADADIQLNRQVGDYQIQARRIEQSRKDELKAATSETERAEVNKRHDEQKAEAFQTLAQKLEDSREELVQRAGETVVREVETAKKEDEKQGIEDKVRAHLRGFSRTIPSFLMAYGEEGTTLANFDTVIPADVFQDVTSITVDEFRFLRDGGDYTDGETGEVKRFVGHLFDEVVFNDSVSEFIKLRERLANYFDESQTEDIFDYVPPQKTNQIFTPRNVVVQMVDLFEKENPGCFDDPSHTFADLYMKSGLYITEIIKRLYRSEGMKAAFPDDRERLDHILEHQVFGIAPTKIIYEIATHFILGFHDEVGQGCDSNFELADAAELAKEGTLEAYVERVFGPKLGEA